MGADSDRECCCASAGGTRMGAPEGLRPPSDEAIAACLPTIVRAHLLDGHAAPEHRTASIAFLQFTGLDRADCAHGAERAGRGSTSWCAWSRTRAERYEVCFLDSDLSADGGKIRLSAGAPRVVGDDEERMLLALRADRRSRPAAAGPGRGQSGSGVHGRGRPAYRRWYAVMGDTVNLAARVMGKAPAGHFYATRDVLRRRGRFDQTALEPFSVKGKPARSRPGTLGRRSFGPRTAVRPSCR